MKDRVLRRARQQWLICEEVLSQDISRVSGEDVHLVPLQILASDVQEYYRRNLRRRFTNDRECYRRNLLETNKFRCPRDARLRSNVFAAEK